ncbi:unnamed protein product [Brachionus calyciflorus]|uniref:Uncharacterized protein n=1 Tax=Brachionus calyciflorus TaxID=104777 RepID=A0A814A7R9_9BILA|nr:unnamed protein product [Brachionus calyciflorus]
MKLQNEIKTNRKKRVCPVPGCDSKGNTISGRSNHFSINNCPLAKSKLGFLSKTQMESSNDQILNAKIENLEKRNFDLDQDLITAKNELVFFKAKKNFKRKKYDDYSGFIDQNFNKNPFFPDKNYQEKDNYFVNDHNLREVNLNFKIALEDLYDRFENFRRKYYSINKYNVDENPLIGLFRSDGQANGSSVFLGPNNGVFYINASENKSWLTPYQKLFSVEYIF